MAKTPKAEMNRQVRRCQWAQSAPMIEYHDKEWGVPLRDDRKLFEMLILEGAQAGLSWETILKKREAYRQAFDRFDPAKIAGYDGRKIRELMANSGIVRNRLKIEATITNAQSFLAVKQQYGSFDRYIWEIAAAGGAGSKKAAHRDGRPPASTPVSDAMSRQLKKDGFRFVGSTICYAFMQAVGIVNDHSADCFRRREIEDAKRPHRANR